MTTQMLSIISFLVLVPQMLACQPALTTVKQLPSIVVANPPVETTRFVNVEAARIPITRAATTSTKILVNLLKVSLPTLTTDTTTTTSSFDTTDEFKTNPTSIAVGSSDSLSSPKHETNLTNDSDIAKQLMLAKQAVLSTFSNFNKNSDLSWPPIKLYTATPKKAKCENATITAITTITYDDRLISMSRERIREQIKLLEMYTQQTLLSFGEYSEEATSIDTKFALRFYIEKTSNCINLRNFATKAVSYSREIERVRFSCHCEPMWIITKRRTPVGKRL